MKNWADVEAAAMQSMQNSKSRYFESGATRDTDEGKFDYEGFLHPVVLEMYAQYMHENRVQSDGEMRDSDNWQKGIPRKQYMKSMWRHFHEVWKAHRAGYAEPCAGYDPTPMHDALCALMFNVMGYLYEMTQNR